MPELPLDMGAMDATPRLIEKFLTPSACGVGSPGLR